MQMSKFLDKIKKIAFKEVPTLKTIISVGIILIVGGYGVIILGRDKFFMLSVLFTMPIITYFSSEDVRSVKSAESLQMNSMVVIIMVSFFILGSYTHYETYLEKKLLEGTVHSYTSYSQNEDGEEIESIEKRFTPSNESDKIWVDVIAYVLGISIFASPYLTYVISQRTIKKHEKYI